MNISPIQMKSELQQHHSQTKMNNSLSFTSVRGTVVIEKIIENKVTDEKQLSNLLKSLGFGRYGMFPKKQITEILEELLRMYANIQNKANEKVVKANEYVDKQMKTIQIQKQELDNRKAKLDKLKEDLDRRDKFRDDNFCSREEALRKREAALRAKQKELEELEKELNARQKGNSHNNETHKGWTREQFITHIETRLASKDMRKSSLTDTEVRNLAKLLDITPDKVLNLNIDDYRKLCKKFHPDTSRVENSAACFRILNSLFKLK